MEDLGRGEEVNGIYLFNDLISKLDTSDQATYNYQMNISNKTESVHSLLEWLELQAKCRSRGQAESRSSQIGTKAHIALLILHIRIIRTIRNALPDVM